MSGTDQKSPLSIAIEDNIDFVIKNANLSLDHESKHDYDEGYADGARGKSIIKGSSHWYESGWLAGRSARSVLVLAV